MAINVGAVMDSIGTGLATISGLRVFDFPPKSAQPPFAFVDVPEAIDYDATYGRGFDRMTLRVFVGVSKESDRAARDAIATFAAGGAGAVKAVIDASGAGSSVRTTRCEFGPISLSGVLYAGAVFTVDVLA